MCWHALIIPVLEKHRDRWIPGVHRPAKLVLDNLQASERALSEKMIGVEQHLRLTSACTHREKRKSVVCLWRCCLIGRMLTYQAGGSEVQCHLQLHSSLQPAWDTMNRVSKIKSKLSVSFYLKS